MIMGCDIYLVSEIITNSMYWQAILHRESDKLAANLEHIFNIGGIKRISIYH